MCCGSAETHSASVKQALRYGGLAAEAAHHLQLFRRAVSTLFQRVHALHPAQQHGDGELQSLQVAHGDGSSERLGRRSLGQQSVAAPQSRGGQHGGGGDGWGGHGGGETTKALEGVSEQRILEQSTLRPPGCDGPDPLRLDHSCPLPADPWGTTMIPLPRQQPARTNSADRQKRWRRRRRRRPIRSRRRRTRTSALTRTPLRATRLFCSRWAMTHCRDQGDHSM